MKKLLILLSVLAIMTGCSQKWPCGWKATPADCLDRQKMDAHFAAHPDRWKATFEFLKNTDLESLELGEYEILGRDVYAIVSEYLPKEAEDCRFESHKKYIDLQYLISGEEMMGVTATESLEVVVPYVEDIMFYTPEGVEAVYEKAVPGKFFVFFPDDAHRPSMKSAEGVSVKKVVVKVLY